MEYLTDPCKQRAKAREEGQSENVAQEFSELMRVDGGRSECTSSLILEETATQRLPLDLQTS